MVFVRDDVAEVLKRLAEAPGPRLSEVDVATARKMTKAMIELMERPAPPLARSEDFFLNGPAGNLRARLYQAGPPADDTPLIVYFHGGGWVVSDLDTYHSLCAEIALASGWTVVSIDYRLAPEHPFPAAIDDAVAAARMLADAPDILGHSISGLILAGDSGGGNIAAAATREVAGDLPLLGQWLLYPATDMRWRGGSMDEFAQGYLLTIDDIRWFGRNYAPDADSPRASPLRASNWAGLPPTLVLTCGLDPLRDQGRAYAAKLAETGNRLIFREAAGQIHGSMTLRRAIPSAHADLLAQIADLKALIA